MKYWRILIVLLFPLIGAVATVSGIYSLATSLLTIVTTDGYSTASYMLNTNVFIAALLVAVIASLFLAVSWWTFKPKVAYMGGICISGFLPYLSPIFSVAHMTALLVSIGFHFHTILCFCQYLVLL